MAKFGDIREQVLLEVFLLGLRVRDVSELKWQTFAVNGETPIPILILTRKEDVTARTFIRAEFKELLNKYLPILEVESISVSKQEVDKETQGDTESWNEAN
jgi:hypothetical protein